MLENLPVFMMRELVLLPYQEVKLELNNVYSKKIVDISLDKFDNKILVIDSKKDNYSLLTDLPECAILARIKSKLELPNGNYRVTLSGINRVISYVYDVKDDITIGSVKRTYVDNINKTEEQAILRTLKTILNKYMELNPNSSNSIRNALETVNDLDMLTDLITNYLPLDKKKKANYMNEFDPIVRGNNLIKDINVELEVLNIESKVDEELRVSFDKEQRDYIIKQKINKLNEELGDNDDKKKELEDLIKRVNVLNLNDKTKNRLLNEIKKYRLTNDTNPDSSVIRNYLDTVINLPWNNSSKEETDLKKIRKILDKNHYGMNDIKNRVLEYIAIKKNSKDVTSPIICLVGPPGVGKTTISKSISEALNREFVKISVGGLNDASELNGHKRTYLGSSPGKIISGLKKCETNNPVMLIDEVDKIVSNYKGDPSAVLLDILDKSQNNNFIDNYVEEPFDLSNIIFILTANDINNIPRALKDRLEIINLSSYTEEEKINIAKKYLIPKITIEYNINKIKISDEDLHFIITSYTKESGVRELDRILRNIYRFIILNELNIKVINKNKIEEILGPIKYSKVSKLKDYPGNVCTVGVSNYGGVPLEIESALVPGNNTIVLTGNVTETVKESSFVIYNYMLTKTKEYGIDEKRLKGHDMHINLLNYSIKKDGISGSLAILTSMISTLLKKKIDSSICFTGEVSLHGDINKVGGIKEKIIGAYNNGYKTIFIPEDNKKELVLIDDDIKNKISIKCVNHYDQVFDYLFK